MEEIIVEPKYSSIDEMIAEGVKKRPLLFNLQHDDYKKIDLKEKAWDEIGRRVHLNGDEVKRKWKNMRDYYYKTKKAQQVPAGSAAAFKKKWKLFESLQFLNDVTRVRRVIIEPSVIEIEDDENTNDSFSETPKTCTYSKRRKIDPLSNSFTDLHSEAETSLKETQDWTRSGQTKSSLCTYFASLADSVEESNLTRKQILQLKKDIGDLVFSRLQELEDMQD